jgi:hypothetical protein
MLERLLARRFECGSAAARFRPPRPDRKPALLALEDREAPQLMVPMAVAVGGAIFASQVLASQARASSTEHVNVSVVDKLGDQLPQLGHEPTAAGGTAFRPQLESALFPTEDDSEFRLVASLDPTNERPTALRPGVSPTTAGGEIMPAFEQSFAAGGLSWQSAPSLGAFSSFPADDSGGGGGSTGTGSTPHGTTSNAAPAQLPQTPDAPAASASSLNASLPPLSGAPSSSDLNTISHGLASPQLQQPSTSPQPAASPQPGISPNFVQGPGILAIGPDAGNAPTVKVYDPTTLQLKFTITAYDSSMTGGVRVAVGDVNGDGTPDIITAPGKGGGSLIKVFSGVDGSLLLSFNAYAPGQTDGAFVAAGDVNADGHADIITGTDVGAKPLVKVFSGLDDSLLGSFISDPTAGPNGVRVAAGDVTASGHADIVTGAGPGGVPRVTVVDGQTFKPIYNFFPFNEDCTSGVYVSAGNLLGDGHADIVTSRGGGDIPEVSIWKGANLTPLGNFMTVGGSAGVRVGVADVGGDGQLDVLTTSGPGGSGQLSAFIGNTLQADSLALAPNGLTFSGGLFVAGDAQPHPVAKPTPTSSGGGTLSPGGGSGLPGTPVPPPGSGGTGGGGFAFGPGGGIHPLVTPVVTVTVDKSNIFDNGTATFTFTRTGDTSSPLTVSFAMGGNAIAGTDYNSLPNQVNFGINQSTATAGFGAIDDHKAGESKEEAVLTISSGMGYTVGSPGSASVEIDEEPGPVIGDTCSCGGGKDLASTNPAVADNPAPGSSAAGVSYFDGVIKAGAAFLGSSGFGVGCVPLPEFPVALAA